MSSNIKIGISPKFHSKAPVFYGGEVNRHIQYLETSVANWIAQNNALPFMLPTESSFSSIDEKILDANSYAEEMDALILQGGVDVHPSLYGVEPNEKYNYDLVRDRYEMNLIEAFLKHRKPILGICRGMQLLNVYFGGNLRFDLEAEGFKKHHDPRLETQNYHQIKIQDNSHLSQIFEGCYEVVSMHHQAIKKLGDGLTVEAIATEDNVIEAVSRIDSEMYILAVQWHPEFHPVDKKDVLNANKLFQQFLKVVKNRKFYGDLSFTNKKKLKIGKSSSLSLGVELELQLLDKTTKDLTPSSKDILSTTYSKTKKIKSEIFQSMIEIESSICTNAHEIEKDLSESINILKQSASAYDVVIGSSGIHPFALYKDRIITDSPRYRTLIKEKQWIARRISIFGLHCHVGAQSSEEAISLYNFYLSVAPILLAISASSPFFQGELTGLESVRSTFFESIPSGGHPPKLSSWSEFEGMLTKMIKSNSIGSHKDLWWDVRPSMNYGTIEIRICDMMPTLKENVVLVALIHFLGHCYLLDSSSKVWPKLSDWSYRENKWRALRHGLNYEFIYDEAGNTKNVREFLTNIIDHYSGVISDLGYDEKIEYLVEKMLKKTPSQRQIDIFEKTNSFQKVVDSYVL